MKKLLVSLALALMSASVLAQSAASKPLYVELGYSPIEIKDNNLPGQSFDNAVLTGIVGYKFHENLAGELFLATGVSDDTIRVGGSTYTADVKNSYGLFLKPTVMLGRQFELFGRLGFTRSELDWTENGVRTSESETSFAYGAGFNYHFTDTFYGQAAYMSYHDKDGTDAKGLLLALGLRF